ncbi:hypothetical protein D6D01_07455 [Aureobasidium pullulans]|uniref:DUF7708 domain-containing protein n=1 Tax=Aureobasidium pullulans TaxID=5580 RepID=A0A4S9KPM6_AURPU|nr:hypothetical protein D6D01_07455 [Aureobasidium pullulans]
MASVLSVAETARSTTFPTTSKWIRLNSISSRIVYYGTVLDVLSQHHPEYVSLAWGAVKFVLMGVINHGELLNKFTQAFSEIGDALKVAACSALVYETADIETTISRLYLQIMRFLHKAVRWYTSSPIVRVLKGIVKPYELSWKEDVDSIRSCLARVKDHAEIASWAELRVVHDVLTTQGSKIDVIGLAVSNLQNRLDGMFQLLEHQLQETLSQYRLNPQIHLAPISELSELTIPADNKAISMTLREDMDYIRPGIRDLQVNAILENLQPALDPDQNLLQTQLILGRNNNMHDHLRNRDHVCRYIQRWSDEPASSLLIVRATVRSRVMVKTILLDLISTLRASARTVFFTLPRAASRIPRDQSLLLSSWVQALVHQVLKTKLDFLLRSQEKSQVAQYCENHSPKEWMHLLGQVLASIPYAYFIIDTSDLYEQYRNEPDYFRDLINLFRTLMASVTAAHGHLKIFIVGYGSVVPNEGFPVGGQVRELLCSLQYRAIPPKFRAQYSTKTRIQRIRMQRLSTARIA